MPCNWQSTAWRAPPSVSPASGLPGLPHTMARNARNSCGCSEPLNTAGLIARGVPPQTPAWRSCCRNRQIKDTFTPSGRALTAAALRGRKAADRRPGDPAQAEKVAQPHEGQQQQRRRALGPAPPPLQPTDFPSKASTSASAQSDAFAETTLGFPVAESFPTIKRRGRPPKRHVDAATLPQPPHQPVPSLPPAKAPPVATVPLAEAAAALAMALNESSSSSSRSRDNAARKPFGPEPPSLQQQQKAATAAPPSPDSINSTANAPFLFSLPEDPSELNIDDILDLPLPDPRVGEPFRLGGDLNELAELGEASGVGSRNDDGAIADEDEDPDLDYDELIALAGKVDAARYIARAFERAKQGLETVADPMLTDFEAGPRDKDLTQNRLGSDQTLPPSHQQQAPFNSDVTTGVVGWRRSDTAIPAMSGDAPGSRSSSHSDSTAYVDDEIDNDGEFTADEDGAEAEAAAQRRVALLLDLLSASGAELEGKLEAAAPEVDEQLLALLERRYIAALRLRQDAQSTERIATLYRALRYVHERRTSSAAERLLDDVLGILGDAQLQPDAERRRGEAAARLRNAFTGGMLDVDVFTAAAALAEGRQAAAEALAGEQVSVETFKAEAMGLLNHAKRVQQETNVNLETIGAEVSRLQQEEAAVLEGREWKLRLEQIRLARQALVDREESIAALEEVLLLTRAVEIQMLTGRMGS